MKVIWTPRAQQRLKEHYDHIAEDQPGNAQRWMARVLARDEQISVHPYSGRQVPEYQRDDIREILEGDYRIIYRIKPERIDVLTVRHGARLLPKNSRHL